MEGIYVLVLKIMNILTFLMALKYFILLFLTLMKLHILITLLFKLFLALNILFNMLSCAMELLYKGLLLLNGLER